MTTAEVSTPSGTEVSVKRRFAATVQDVWRAYTEPELIQQWMLGPPGWSMPVCEMDVRVSGTFRWRWRSADDDNEFGFTGEFREVENHSRIVHTQIYKPGISSDGDGDGCMGNESLVTVTFVENDGETDVSTTIKFASQEDRDAAVSTGMTDGMELSYKQLDSVLD